MNDLMTPSAESSACFIQDNATRFMEKSYLHELGNQVK